MVYNYCKALYHSNMFAPKYTLTNTILQHINEIERLYGRLESLRLPKALQLNLERDNLIQSAYISNSIEGNPLSEPEVTNLLLDDRVPVNRDEKEVRNYFDILKSLRHYQKQVGIDTILSIHGRLLTGVMDDIAGTIRNRRVVVGKYKQQADGELSIDVKHEPPYHSSEQIIIALQELNSWLEDSNDIPAVIQTAIFHHEFVYIHPFADGNGRTCRLLTAQLLLQREYAINKYFVLDDWYDVDRAQYSDKLNTADSGDKTEWVEYFAEGMKYSLQSALAKAEHAIEQIEIPRRLTKREKEVYAMLQARKQLKANDVAFELAVSRQYAHRLLKSLVDKGFADEQGETKGRFYILK